MGAWWSFQHFAWFCVTDLLAHTLCPFDFERCVKTKTLRDMAADLARIPGTATGAQAKENRDWPGN